MTTPDRIGKPWGLLLGGTTNVSRLFPGIDGAVRYRISSAHPLYVGVGIEITGKVGGPVTKTSTGLSEAEDGYTVGGYNIETDARFLSRTYDNTTSVTPKLLIQDIIPLGSGFGLGPLFSGGWSIRSWIRERKIQPGGSEDVETDREDITAHTVFLKGGVGLEWAVADGASLAVGGGVYGLFPLDDGSRDRYEGVEAGFFVNGGIIFTWGADLGASGGAQQPAQPSSPAQSPVPTPAPKAPPAVPASAIAPVAPLPLIPSPPPVQPEGPSSPALEKPPESIQPSAPAAAPAEPAQEVEPAEAPAKPKGKPRAKAPRGQKKDVGAPKEREYEGQ